MHWASTLFRFILQKPLDEKGTTRKKWSQRDSVDIWWLALIDVGSLFANPSSDWLTAQHERFLNGLFYPTLSRLSSTKAVRCSMYIFPAISWWRNNAIRKKYGKATERQMIDTTLDITLPYPENLTWVQTLVMVGYKDRHRRKRGWEENYDLIYLLVWQLKEGK